jgi:ADP-ribosyl-[dinitrogen reductase] hydrolase
MCRKAHGTALSTHLILRPDQLTWDAGGDLEAYESSAGAYRAFCPSCGTHLLVHGQSGDGTVAIPAGTLDGKPPVTILGHMYVEELVPWHAIVDDLPRYERWPPGYGKTDD